MINNENETLRAAKELETKERLIQTYIIIQGLLLTYNLNEKAHYAAMIIFILYLLPTLEYYTQITIPNHRKERIYKTTEEYLRNINLNAVLSALMFSFTVTIYLYYLGKDIYLGKDTIPPSMNYVICVIGFIILTTITIRSLLVRPKLIYTIKERCEETLKTEKF